MELAVHEKKEKKIGYQTIQLVSGKRLKIDIPSVAEILDFTADKNYVVQISVVLTEE